jgi:hypothetical protein
VADPEIIIRTLITSGKTTDSPELAQCLETIPPAGQQFVGIGLVPHVPDEPVPSGIEGFEQCQGKFDDPE